MILLHQATAVAIAGRALLIEGAPGSGKSSLALALIDRGAELIGDDGVSLERSGKFVLVSPAPATRGLMEVRNVGLITLPAASRIPVSLVIALTRDAPRHVDAAEPVMRAGVQVPLIRVWPDSPVLALRAEHALRLYGIG